MAYLLFAGVAGVGALGFRYIMGSGDDSDSLSGTIILEKQAWIKNHDLDLDSSIHKGLDGQRMVEEFGDRFGRARMCARSCRLAGVTYDHYFITDGSRTFEFGVGQISNNKVEIHNRALQTGYQIAAEFTVDDKVRERMRSVLGATNYSLCLRNCEHVARYVYCKSWICYQMVSDGSLAKAFARNQLG